jgi:hypothetical protein
MNRLAIALALSVAVPSGALAASRSGGSERPNLQKELHRLVSAGAPGPSCSSVSASAKFASPAATATSHSALRCGRTTVSASRA